MQENTQSHKETQEYIRLQEDSVVHHRPVEELCKRIRFEDQTSKNAGWQEYELQRSWKNKEPGERF